MEEIVKHCENFCNILEIEDWATRVDRVNEIEVAFKLANFISTIFIRLDEDHALKKFVESNEKLKDKKSALKHPFESLLLSLADTEDDEMIDFALQKYMKVRGNADSVLNCPLYSAELLETLLEVFAKSDLNVCSEVVDSFERLTIDDHINDYINFVLNDDDKINVTSLLIQCLNTKKEEVKMKILNHILEKARDIEENKGFWNKFVNCEHKILIKTFQEHSWFFEEFFEFLLLSVQYFKCSFDDNGQREWSGHSWLSFDELVKLVQSLWNIDDYVGSYVKQIVSGTEGEKPIWKDVMEKLTQEVENVQQLPLKVDVMYSRSDPDTCVLTLKK